MALLDVRSPAPQARPWWRRGTGAALVALVHAVLIAFVLSSLPRSMALLPSQREIFYFFHPARKPPRPVPPAVAVPARPGAPPVFRYTPPPPPASGALSPPAVTGLGLSLFGCAPETLANLSPRERAHCGGAPGLAALRSAIPGTLTIHAQQAARWAAGIAARNAPLAVPCTSLEQIPLGGPFQDAGVGPGGTAKVVMVDPACAARLINSFGTGK